MSNAQADTGTMSEAAKGHFAMLLFSALIAGSFSLGSLAANEIAPAALNIVRFFIAASVIGTAALVTRKFTRAAFRAPWRYGLMGGLFAIYFVLMFEGLKTAPPVSAAAVFTLTPALSALFGYVLLRQILTPRMALALVIGAAGALWVIFAPISTRFWRFASAPAKRFFSSAAWRMRSTRLWCGF